MCICFSFFNQLYYRFQMNVFFLHTIEVDDCLTWFISICSSIFCRFASVSILYHVSLCLGIIRFFVFAQSHIVSSSVAFLSRNLHRSSHSLTFFLHRVTYRYIECVLQIAYFSFVSDRNAVHCCITNRVPLCTRPNAPFICVSSVFIIFICFH